MRLEPLNLVYTGHDAGTSTTGWVSHIRVLANRWYVSIKIRIQQLRYYVTLHCSLHAARYAAVSRVKCMSQELPAQMNFTSPGRGPEGPGIVH